MKEYGQVDYTLPVIGEDWSTFKDENVILNLYTLRLLRKSYVLTDGRRPKGWTLESIGIEFNKGLEELKKRNIPFDFPFPMPLQRVSNDGEKSLTREEVMYKIAEQRGSSCATCQFFLGKNTFECKLVKGLVEPQDVCNAWEQENF